MILPAGVQQSITKNGINISTGRMFASFPIWNLDYSAQRAQPVSMAAVPLADLRFLDPTVTLVIRQSASPTSLVLWSGVAVMDDDSGEGAVHNDLLGRGESGAHPTSAITGLDFFEDFRQSGWTDTQTAQAAAASGRHVTINGGAYTLTAQIVFASNTVFAGRKGAAFTTSAIDRPFLFSGVADSGITGCTLNCSRTNNSTYSHGVISVQSASSRLLFERNKINATNIHCFSIDGVEATANSEIDIRQNRLSHSVKNGFAFHVWMSGRLVANNSGAINEAGNESIRIIGNRLYGGGNGIMMNADDITVSENRLDEVDSPTACTFVRDLKIDKNIIKQFIGNGLTIGNGSDDIIEGFVISNNTLESSINALHGINVYKQGGDGSLVGSVNLGLDRRGTISGNTIYSTSAATQTGIFSYGNGNMAISGNAISGFGQGISANIAATGVHPGKLSITGNEIDDCGTGIGLGSSAAASWKNVSVTGNQLNVTSDGIRLSRLTNFSICGNQINGLAAFDAGIYSGVGISMNNCSKGTVTGNDMDGASGFADFWWQLATNPNILVNSNRGNGFYSRLGANDPIFSGNLKKNGTVIDVAGACENNASNTVTATYQGGQLASENRAGSFLVYYSGSFSTSSNFTTGHSECLALVRATRVAGVGGAWTFSVVYLQQINGATVSVTNTADALAFTGNANIAGVNNSIISVQPFQSALINACSSGAI